MESYRAAVLINSNNECLIIWDQPIAIFACQRAILRAFACMVRLSPYKASSAIHGLSGNLRIVVDAVARTRRECVQLAAHPVLSEGEPVAVCFIDQPMHEQNEGCATRGSSRGR